MSVFLSFKRVMTLTFCMVISSALMQGCTSNGAMNIKAAKGSADDGSSPHYLIGPGDNLTVFVWGNAELTASVPVRPDGRITTPLIEDVVASGHTSTELARIMEGKLSRYMKNPVVTVYVTGFGGLYSKQVRIVGQASKPQAIAYQNDMTLLDVMIAVGGLTEFAAGNRAKIVRIVNGKNVTYRVRLDDLINDGDISANVVMMPGDYLIIPEAWF